MKRILSLALIAILCISLFAMTASAASASASLTGPGVIRAGDTITLSFNLSGSGLFGASGTLSYNSSQLTLAGTSQKIGAPWAVEFNGNNFVAYDNNLTNPINSNVTLFTVTFKVNAGVAVGTKVNVSYTDVAASDGNADTNVGTVTYSATVAAPLSTDNALKSLTVSNATISPAFNTNTTSYTAEVPFSVSKLEIQAVANDSKATVSVNSPNLTPNGTTNVTITVKAENGSSRTYTIAVKRAQDPNYVASGNNDLSEITVDCFLLSPVFSGSNTQYVIWLPYETESVVVNGTAADSKASVRVEGGTGLKAGQDNEIKVICTAENGTEKVYTVIAKRAAAHDGSVEPTDPPTEPTEPSEPSTQPSTDPSTAPSTDPSVAPTAPQEPTQQEKSGGIPWWTLLIVGAVCLGLGILIDKKLLRKS